MKLQDLLPRLRGVRGSGNQYSACCPAHDDNRASLRLSETDTGKLLIMCHAGCSLDDICKALDISKSDLFPNNDENRLQGRSSTSPTVVKQYIYNDINGLPMLKKSRTADKSFFWEYYDRATCTWQKGRNGITPPLYKWDLAKRANVVYIVEGEKDVDTLTGMGLAAVSLADGAKSKWQNTYSDFFSNKIVVIIPDNDKPGREYADMIAEKLLGVACEIKLLDLRELWKDMPEHGDISDMAEKFGDISAVRQLAKELLPYTPPESQKAFKSLAGIEARTVNWLWYPYIPRGKITLLTADPGTGKTFFSLYLAACVSNGQPFWHDELEEAEQRQPMKVVYQTAEDGYSDTIKPRLEPMNANFDNIVMIDEENEALTLTDEVVETVLKELKPVLMIFDPIQAYLGSKIDMHRANEVRPVLGRIAHLAEKYDCAMLFIMHHNKNSKGQALYRALGSIDIPAIARSMLIMANSKTDKGLKMIFHEKSSLAPHGKALTFRIEDGVPTFQGFSDKRADDVISMPTNLAGEIKENIKKDLLELMQPEGYALIEDVETLKAAFGWSSTTLKRAKQEMGIQTVILGFEKKKTWWLLPEVDAEAFKKQKKAESEPPKNETLKEVNSE